MLAMQSVVVLEDKIIRQ